MVPEVTLVMLDQEETLERLDQRGIREDLASAILEQGDHRVIKVGKVNQDPEVAEETVGPRDNQERKEPLEILVSRDLMESLVGEEHKEIPEQME